ncbi:inositol monophosphatase family protein [Streptococcus halotolerans]|uniref:inositol monophosphatase family protein n=1 Tax=Streptococcus halotolerans TaxID=1814128 RepID=UPI000787A921|nr:inositol monophosphatase family protein [Streptococcus halotolerans]
MESKFLFAKSLIKEAGLFIKDAMHQDFDIEVKADETDLVTSLDKQCQELMIKAILKAYPDDHFLAEEDDVTHPISDGKVWVLDPIDGTVNFIAQQDHFAIMIAYYENGVGQFGLILDVMKDVLYSGGGQFDVYANDVKLETYHHRSFKRSLVGVNAQMYLENTNGLREFTKTALGIRVYGGAGISMAQVMSGKLLAYFSHIAPWDYAAASIMGEKLGYCLLTVTGQKADFKNRQKVMFVPKEELSAIQKFVH